MSRPLSSSVNVGDYRRRTITRVEKPSHISPYDT